MSESLVSNPDVIFVFVDKKINKVDHIPCLSFSLFICEMGNLDVRYLWWCSSAVPQPVLTVIEQEAF